MQDARYIADPFALQVRSLKPILIGTFIAMLALLALMRVMPEEGTPLLAKVMTLLAPTLATASMGAYVGRNLRGWLPVIGLLLLSIAGMFIIASLGGSTLAVGLLLGWGFINGMMLGPLVGFAIAEEGPGVVMQALTGTTAVMLGAGFVALATGIDLSMLGPLLFLGLIGLIIAGLVRIFVRFSRVANMTYSVIGMVIFAGYFLYDFFRLGKAENTWERAVLLTTSLYLDFANFFIYLLQFLLSSRRR